MERKALKVKNSIRINGRIKHETIWKYEALPEFLQKPQSRKCGFCKEIPVPVLNSLTCPLRINHSHGHHQGTGRPRKPLMELTDRKQGKERIKPLLDFFELFCETNKEDKKDVLAFQYRRELNNRGKYREAKNFDSFNQNPSLMMVKPLSPRKTASRSVMSGMS